MERYNFSKVKKPITILLTCLTAYLIGRALFLISGSEFGVGNVIRAFFPAVLCIGGLVLFVRPDLLPWGIQSTKIGIKEGLLILFIALLVAFSPLLHVSNLTHLLVLLIPLIGLLTAMYLILTRDDVLGIVVFLFTEPFLSYAHWEIPFLHPKQRYGNVITVSYVAILLIMVLAVYRILKDDCKHLVRTKLDKYVLAFIMVLLLASIASPDPSKSFGVFFQIGIIMAPIFFLVSNHIHTKKDIMLLLKAFIFVGVMKCFMFGYFQWKALGFSFDELVGVRGMLTSGIPAALGGPIPIAISMAIIYSGRSKKWVYYALAAIIFFSFILISQTRSSLISLVVTGVPMILFYRRGKRWIFAGLVAMVLLLFVSGSVPFFFKRYEKLTSTQGLERALAMRKKGWKAAIGMIRDHPFTGIGPGMWLEFIPIYSTPDIWVIEGQRSFVYVQSAHHGYLHNGAEAGVGAALVLFFIYLTASIKIFSVMKRVKDDDIYTIAVGLAWSCMRGIFMGPYFSLYGYISVMGFWGTMAVIMAVERVAQPHSLVIGDEANRATETLQ
jgi:O-antigen ligase